VDNDLKLLIDHYESEQKTLQFLLNDCLLEEDYKFAKYYSKNLRLAQKRLYVLYCLSDNNYAEKTEVLKRIKNFELKLKKLDSQFREDFIEIEIHGMNTTLAKLKELPIIEVEEKHDLENATIQLLENKIKGFKLISKQLAFYINFSLRNRDVIQIKFTPFNDSADYSFFDGSQIKRLQKLGFNLNYNTLYTNVDVHNQSTQVINILLSRIFFEIFYWHRWKLLELVIY
jgi:hypothetical protein